MQLKYPKDTSDISTIGKGVKKVQACMCRTIRLKEVIHDVILTSLRLRLYVIDVETTLCL